MILSGKTLGPGVFESALEESEIGEVGAGLPKSNTFHWLEERLGIFG